MISKMNTAIIVAAGNGSRLGSDTPKQFLKLKGREILSYSIQAFREHPEIDHVIIVTSDTFLDHVASNYPDCQVVLGGATRQDSVFNGLNACSLETEVVLIHDAARPLLPVHIIDNCLKAMEVFDGVAPAIEPIDSMVQILGDTFNNLKRNDLKIVQTPQCFHLDILRQAHASGKIDTDEMGLVKQTIPNAQLGFVEGAPENMKITRSIDFSVAEIYLRSMQS